jgi:WD40 repeat protein
MAFDSQSTRLFSLHRGDGTLAEWNRTTRELLRVWHLAVPLPARLVGALSSNDRWLAVADYGGKFKLIDLAKDRQIDGDLQMTQVSQLALSHDGGLLAASSWKGFTRIWKTSNLTAPPVVLGPLMHGVFSVAFSPDGRRLALTSDGPEAVLLWDLDTYREVLTLEAKGGGFRSLAFSPDGHAVGARTAVGRLHLWRAPSWEQVRAMELPQNTFSP